MQLLSSQKVRLGKKLQDDEEQLSRLKVQRKTSEEQRKFSESVADWDNEKKKSWEAFCRWNQTIQVKKALLLSEIEFLERKRDALVENIKVYL